MEELGALAQAYMQCSGREKSWKTILEVMMASWVRSVQTSAVKHGVVAEESYAHDENTARSQTTWLNPVPYCPAHFQTVQTYILQSWHPIRD